METWLIVLIAVVVALLLIGLVLTVLRRRPDEGQKRVEARARFSKADRHEETARRAAAEVDQERDIAVRERELSAQHANAADDAEQRAQEKARLVKENETAADEQREQARKIEPS